MKALLILALGITPLALGAGIADGREIEVGAARVDITPEGPIRLSGYAVRSSESKGIQQRIWAKALAIGSDAQGPSVLVTVDNLGIPDAVTEEVAARLKRRAGLARERLALGSSHSHSAPCLTNVAPNLFGKPIPADQQARIDRYTRDLIDKLEQVCLEALRNRRPGTLEWGQGRVGFAMNRRTKGGPVDQSLPVLRATGRDGSTVAIVVGYACHCTTLDPNDNLVSGDWAGDAQEAIEADHPGAVALVLIGCAGDANPEPRMAREAARRHGRAIADEAGRLLKGALKPLDTPPVGKLQRVDLPFDTLPTREELKALIAKGGFPGYNALTQLARLDRGEPLQDHVDYVVQSWQFGDELAMVFLAGEVVVDYALRLKTEFDASRLWVVAYANDVPCYIPSERILREGGYEGGGAMVYYGRPTRLKPGVEERIITTARSIVPAAFASRGDDMPPPQSPKQALQSFRTKPGLRIELVAAEPLVLDPVAIDFGADGKLWVCEMRDYPSGMDGKGKPGGRITYLEDTNGDQKYDRVTTFLEDVPFPTGVMAWGRGVLVCAAPDLFYAEDTNGDGKADLKNLLFQGFATENYQARVNGLAYGLDNWVYGANGLIGGTIRGEKTGKEVILGGRDFRIKPDADILEPASGLTQQGRVRDDWGDQFGGNNGTLIQHYPLPDHYARRNQFIAAPHPSVYVPRDSESHRLYPISKTLERYNHPESANQVTSACSPLIHRDPYLGTQYFGNAFTCEPVHNLVHREVVKPDGITFAGHRADDEQTSEFLASSDNWFRPVQVRTGLDGAIYVVDMYRFVIEHPRWISPDRLAHLDVRAGDDRGRIYRIVREDLAPRDIPELAGLATPALAAAIDSPNGPLRDLVQRLVVERKDKSAVSVLAMLADKGRQPEGRMQALCALDGLEALTAAQLRPALLDPHPGVRRQAVRLSERWLGSDPEIGSALLGLVEDPDIWVRYQLALSLGEWDDARAGQALGRVAVRDAGDEWVRAAVLSSASRRPGEILSAVLAAKLEPADRSALLEPLITTVAASASPEQLLGVIDACSRREGNAIPAWRIAALATLLDAGERPGRTSEAFAKILKSKADQLRSVVREATILARDERAKPADRATAIRLLGRQPESYETDVTLLGELLGPRSPSQVQAAVVKALARLQDPRANERLIAQWSSLGPALRGTVLDALLARPAGTTAVLDALEAGKIHSGEIDAAHHQRLRDLDDKVLRHRASRILAIDKTRGRHEVVDTYRRQLAAFPGNAARGAELFSKTCAGCHRVAGKGHVVGPDLEALTDTSVEALSLAILDPNREVDARYLNYAAGLIDGRVVTGMIASETGNAITLKRQDNQADVILRTDLEELKSTGQSLMPEGLERELTPANLADLIAFLNKSDHPKSILGNHPERVVQSANGTIRLNAATASIFGSTLIFEPQFGNLGYWHSSDDRAVWTFHVDRPGGFTLSLEWACPESSAGNSYQIRIGDETARGVVGPTGSYANYRSFFVEELSLPAGNHRLEVRSVKPIEGALFDLRAVVLTPR